MKTSKRTQIAQAVLSANRTGKVAVLAADLNQSDDGWHQLLPADKYPIANLSGFLCHTARRATANLSGSLCHTARRATKMDKQSLLIVMWFTKPAILRRN
ncbi:hypothetical protein [Photobacterium lipolyticum]|uniref:Uncharacterized protein n=1 Tax=Photobacterium lipolyticum TaxID=266810 RepID=A0A2T3N229_9GAMM|nr:hypothetical protein [Photobacterium lipolyticum]PSW06328.1 hypothetical protein C9I89_07430 [Photobacterium lipolyticum]